LPIVAVVGSRKSGKTTTVETLVRGLTEKGYRVGTAKHVPEDDFTIDTKGKDTWRHAKAGAHTVASIARNEIAVIKKIDTTNYSLKKIVEEYQDEVDVIILEGFSKLTERDPHVPKIVAIKAVDEVTSASSRFNPILSFVGPIPIEANRLNIPYVDVLREPEKLIDLVDKRLAGSAKSKKKREEKLKIQIDGKPLPMNPFVQKMIRNSLLAMVSTLKNSDVEGNEKVSITIEKPV
jgi:molybdopterin-guanine dinucleotide biosynthesis protein B